MRGVGWDKSEKPPINRGRSVRSVQGRIPEHRPGIMVPGCIGAKNPAHLPSLHRGRRSPLVAIFCDGEESV